MIINKEIIVNRNIKNAWQVLGVEFADAYKWASLINHSEGSGDSFNGASCSERGCSTQMGELKEKILQFSKEDYSLKYQINEGMPSMVKYATNSWKLIPLSQDQSRLEMQMDIQVGGFMGWMMQPMMKMQMSKMGDGLAEEFKYYVENNRPHPRKVKAIKKYNS